MIKITMCNGKWRIHVSKEIFEFSETSDFETVLAKLCEIKDNFGRLFEVNEEGESK